MTRSQRRIASEKRRAVSAGVTDAFAPAGFLSENPNRGKRHAARMTDATLVELARAEIAARRPNYSGAARVPTTYRTITQGRRTRDARGILKPVETQGYTI